MSPQQLCMGCMTEKGDASVCSYCGWEDGLQRESASQLPVGAILKGKYLLGRVLGQGGFGITYLGYDLDLERRVAVKEYFPSGVAARTTNDSDVVATGNEARQHFDYGLGKFLQEAQALARFEEHPGIVSVLDFYKAHNTGYFVMPYVEGLTFKRYLDRKDGKLPYELVWKIATHVMDALREVHSVGMLHRDISPDNIYLTHVGRVRILDFGAARFLLGEHSRSLSVLLKPGYAPEEQYRTRGDQGPWTDVYSLGATIYRALTGKVPPESLDRLEKDTLQPPRKLGTEMPAQAESALLKALAVRGRDRFQKMAEFQKALVPPKRDEPRKSGKPKTRTGKRDNGTAKSKMFESQVGWVVALVLFVVLIAVLFWSC